MKFVVSSTDLLQGVQSVSKAIPSKTTFPILENFLFELSGNILKITASDSELTLRTEIEVRNSIEEGNMAVPARHMMDLIKEFPDQPLTISTVSDSSYECSWESGSSTLPFFPADDYPELPTLSEDAVKIDFPVELLLEGITKTIYATGDDERRPVMNGIFFDINTEETTLVASDTHKLLCYTTKDVIYSEPTSFILHKKPAGILKSILGKSTDNVEIQFDSKNITFKFDNILVTCLLIVGKYPKYKDVIPHQNSNILKIGRTQLLNSVRRVSVCVDKASNCLKLNMADNSLEISAQDLGFNIAGYDKVMCQYDGDPLNIGFNSPFLIDILSNLSCENIIMKFADSQRAVLILPSEEEAENEKLCGILMPIAI